MPIKLRLELFYFAVLFAAIWLGLVAEDAAGIKHSPLIIALVAGVTSLAARQLVRAH